MKPDSPIIQKIEKFARIVGAIEFISGIILGMVLEDKTPSLHLMLIGLGTWVIFGGSYK